YSLFAHQLTEARYAHEHANMKNQVRYQEDGAGSDQHCLSSITHESGNFMASVDRSANTDEQGGSVKDSAAQQTLKLGQTRYPRIIGHRTLTDNHQYEEHCGGRAARPKSGLIGSVQ